MLVRLSVNGEKHEADVEPRLLLVHMIREVLRLTGTHIGCDTTHCGACTILMDGRPVKSCTIFAVQAQGKQLMTVEGLEQDGKLHPLQEGFMAEHGLQCGYCTPGMLMTSFAFLKKHPKPSEDDIRWAISGNLCRCTGYVNIVKAVQHAAAAISQGGAYWTSRPRPKSEAWGIRSGGRKIPASSAAGAPTSTTSSCRGCSISTSCGARTPTRRS